MAAEALRALIEETGFSGVVTVSKSGEPDIGIAAGFADRAQRRPNRIDTAFATASMTKGFVAVTVMSLVESGDLALDTRVRDLLGDDLPLVDPGVTIEHLLSHRSGVGDYLDEEQLGDIDEYIFGDTSMHTLETPDDYLPFVAAHPQLSAPGKRFAYNNGGFIMLSLAIERATGGRFHDLVRELVLEPAGMSMGFVRADDLPANVALGYLANGRTNVFHLPVIGGGDGGAYVTAADMAAFWLAFFGGRLVSAETVAAMTVPVSQTNEEGMRYGRGFWLSPSGTRVLLEGMDAGVSARSCHDPATGDAYTVLANDSSGAWPIVRYLEGTGTVRS